MSIPIKEGFDLQPLLALHQLLPEHVGVLRAIAHRQYYSHENLATYQKIAALEPLNEEDLKHAASTAYYDNKYPETIAYLEELKARFQLDFDTYTKLGYAYQQEDAYDKALTEHLEAFQLKSENVWNLTHIGYCYQELEQIDEALIYYQRAYNLDPKDDTSCLNLGWIYLSKLDIQEARRFSEECLAISPRDESAMMNLAHTYLCEGKVAESEAYYLKSAKLCENPKQFRELMKGDQDTLFACYPEIRKDYLRIIVETLKLCKIN